jgi:aminopeptidase N
VYDKGSALLGMFAHALGRDRFLDGLRRLLDAHAGGHVGLAELTAALGPAGADVAAGWRASSISRARRASRCAWTAAARPRWWRR